jgi:hypothetical protein
MKLSKFEIVVSAVGGLSAITERTISLYEFETYTE